MNQRFITTIKRTKTEKVAVGGVESEWYVNQFEFLTKL